MTVIEIIGLCACVATVVALLVELTAHFTGKRL